MSETKYLETHEWYIVDGETFTSGISDYAQGELGDIVFVTLPEVGQEFNKGDAIVEVEATKTVAEAYAPMNCVITCLLYTSPSPRDLSTSRMPSSA